MNASRLIGAVLTLTVASVCVALFAGLPGEREGTANGSYAHDCCGTLRLEDGRMFVGEKQMVRYSVGQDENGPYILPATYVGPWTNPGFEIDGSRPALKLRLDRLPKPTSIRLTDGRKSYMLTRKALPLAKGLADGH